MLQRSKINLRGIAIIIIVAIFGGWLMIYLSSATGPSGDINLDGKVDITDLSILLSNYNQSTTYAKGDIDGNGLVNILDLSIMLSNYGRTGLPEGRILYMEKTEPATDTYTGNPTPTTQQWMRDHWDRALVYSTYWDNKLSWYPNGWVYQDSYAIYTGTALATQHPEWILKDSSGNKLYIPFGCSGGTCPQYAADIGSSAWRQYFIDNSKALIAKGYKGIFVDDVDMDINVGNGAGAQVAPIDPRTGTAMTDTAWKGYFADFMEQLRAALPSAEIIHNSVWFAGGGNHDGANPYITREIKAANYINIERGYTDSGLTGGTGIWSVYALMRFIDNVHSYGSSAVIQSYATAQADMEYNLTGYFLASDGKDYVSTTGGTNPDSWWSIYDINLGSATGARYQWNGLWRRDFANGFVLLNEPGSTTKTVSLGGTFKNTSGGSVSSTTLGATQGAVFQK